MLSLQKQFVFAFDPTSEGNAQAVFNFLRCIIRFNILTSASEKHEFYIEWLEKTEVYRIIEGI